MLYPVDHHFDLPRHLSLSFHLSEVVKSPQENIRYEKKHTVEHQKYITIRNALGLQGDRKDLTKSGGFSCASSH